ncbi:MAG: DUF1292 domain-containing protein [Bacilli bacterium]
MKMIDDKNIVITDTDGVEHLYTILFTFENEERECSYVLFYDKNNEEEIFAMKYDESTNELYEIEDDEEFDEVDEVLQAYINDDKINEIK